MMRAPRFFPFKAAALGWLLAASALTAHAADVIRIGSTPGVTSDAVEAVVAEAKAQGLEVRLVEFTDWTLPNEAVNNGDIDLNFFQHQAFLNNAIKERGYQLQLVGLGLLQNIGIYSNRIQRLQDVPEGAKVSVANDPVNQGRGLLLLQKAGLIKLRQGNAVGASVNDVVENPKKLRFYEIEGPQLIHSLQDVDLAVVWPSYFVNAGKKEQASRALLYSGIDDSFYAMGFVARKDKVQDPKIARFVQLFQQSSKVREVVSARFNNDPKLYTLPWKTP
ncbi:MetQ/NlpA family ABC transporter substrate-binding protein [Acidovorax sp. SUPP2522]|uniref:MetQ/NlpA family ABC transporter substrate-binding protein n=1 Tax=unclassified Acidovorax TaxID=2684926 RepID=UPI00234B3A41|nr:MULTISPECIES: MetQ/NlpA family ABC transporter substrate-binding protein [unclassified Acidovorax]WCM98044.1 MetQ/NlpA family ABC transporter substrate-binding protein [Acidovorax sp. GBBC 1281]GKT16724.1 MetQ/NlpA family ABC transporter substrate-binding protein [Acidovorax sp. SUPP2522]